MLTKFVNAGTVQWITKESEMKRIVLLVLLTSITKDVTLGRLEKVKHLKMGVSRRM